MQKLTGRLSSDSGRVATATDQYSRDREKSLPLRVSSNAISLQLIYSIFSDAAFWSIPSMMTDINILVEHLLQKVIDCIQSKYPVPKKLYIQLDNCNRENKKGHVLSFLVQEKVFEEVSLRALTLTKLIFMGELWNWGACVLCASRYYNYNVYRTFHHPSKNLHPLICYAHRPGSPS